jgi:CxxC motif-containing protein (DUF1111 family)
MKAYVCGLSLWVASCHAAPSDLTLRDRADLTVSDDTRDAFSLPIPALSEAHLRTFFVGNSFFNQNWVMAPATVQDRDGLGPLFNARSCSTCHFRDGRGAPQHGSEPPRGVLLRISMPSGARGAPKPHPVYGDQLQTDALPNLQAEVDLRVTYTEVSGRYADGEPYSLRIPHHDLRDPAYGALPSQLQISARVAPQVIGMGLLQAVPAAELEALATQQDRSGEGISGRVQWLPRKQVGRFGWKAEQATVRAQTAAAFQGDMGITSTLFPAENHSAGQADCNAQPSGGTPELSEQVLASVDVYLRGLAVPAPRVLPQGHEGKDLFVSAQCDRCHVERLQTGKVLDLPELSERTFQPFTDLLLHDLGEGLADHRPSFSASGREWRTAPLWGVGLIPKVNGHSFLLHDGRARSVTEAILWHDGEAKQARTTFVHLSRVQRKALVEYVESR